MSIIGTWYIYASDTLYAIYVRLCYACVLVFVVFEVGFQTCMVSCTYGVCLLIGCVSTENSSTH